MIVKTYDGEGPFEMKEGMNLFLKDLGVKSIKLMTNNPSKLSNIAKLGIKINESMIINTIG